MSVRSPSKPTASQEQPLANRCQLLALVLCENPSSLEPDLSNTLMERLLALLLTTCDPEHQKWLALVTEGFFTLADEPRTISGPKEGDTLFRVPFLWVHRRGLINFRLLPSTSTNDDLPADELLSVIRLFVLLTGNRQMATKFVNCGLSSLLRRLRKSPVTGGS
jgi:E3 ubiquitin-protein ligase HUWE1